MYSLFINTLSTPAFICLFDDERNILDSISWQGKHAEFDTLIESIDMLLLRNSLDYYHLSGILCLVGPGGFTGIRVTTLVANTLGYSFNIPLYPVTVNALFEWQNSPTPWILPLTKTEVLLWENTLQIVPTIVKITSLEAYNAGQPTPLLPETIPYMQPDDYQTFLKNFTFPEKVSLLRPVYARDPNISIRK